MALEYPQRPDNDNNPKSNKSRDEIIEQLPLMKQFNTRQMMKNAEFLNKEQAIDMVKDLIVHIAYKDMVYLKMLKDSLPGLPKLK